MRADSSDGSAARSVRLRPEPLWVRVDRNRAKLVWFVVLFVAGSAVLLTAALVGVPGALIGLAGSATDALDPRAYTSGFLLTLVISLCVLLAAGALAAAVQLANAEDWVRNRFKGVPLPAGAHPAFEVVVAEMALASGLAAPPAIVVLETPTVNAYALGTSRTTPTLGVTRGLLQTLTAEEQRAVVAALVARVLSGDILFATALAALMGPLKLIRGSGRALMAGGGGCADGCAGSGCADGCSGMSDVGDGCGCLFDALDDSSSGGGCLTAAGVAVFMVVVAAITYVAVVGAAWIVTLWGRLLHRTAYEKADAEGMLLLKDPSAMLSALQKAIASDTAIADGDPSYDGIFYTPTSGTPKVERAEVRRLHRLAEVLGVEGALSVGSSPSKQG